jgi:hypothetical protein
MEYENKIVVAIFISHMIQAIYGYSDKISVYSPRQQYGHFKIQKHWAIDKEYTIRGDGLKEFEYESSYGNIDTIYSDDDRPVSIRTLVSDHGMSPLFSETSFTLYGGLKYDKTCKWEIIKDPREFIDSYVCLTGARDALIRICIESANVPAMKIGIYYATENGIRIAEDINIFNPTTGCYRRKTTYSVRAMYWYEARIELQGYVRITSLGVAFSERDTTTLKIIQSFTDVFGAISHSGVDKCEVYPVRRDGLKPCSENTRNFHLSTAPYYRRIWRFGCDFTCADKNRIDNMHITEQIRYDITR